MIFSGYDEFSYAKKAISYGVSAYILKPVNPEEFEKVVGEINEKLAKSEREEKRKDVYKRQGFNDLVWWTVWVEKKR